MEPEIINAINKYYSLKNEYTVNINKEKNKIINLVGLSWKEKRREFKKIKPKCVNCKRAVGTLFSTKIIDFNRHILAICGDKIDPCLLNININLGDTTNINTDLMTEKQDINKFKKDIIIDKNDLIFGYITSKEAIEKYDEKKDDIESINSIYENLLEILKSITDNPIKIENTENKIKNLNKYIDEFKIMNKSFENTKNSQFLQDIVDIYTDKLISSKNKDNNKLPNKGLLREIMNEKYAYSAVEINEIDENNIYTLVQKQYSTEDFEINLGNSKSFSIVSMKYGLKSDSESSISSSNSSSS
jgi:hypothetical protein